MFEFNITFSRIYPLFLTGNCEIESIVKTKDGVHSLKSIEKKGEIV